MALDAVQRFFSLSPSRPPRGRERIVLAKRCERLRELQASIEESTTNLQNLVSAGTLDAFRLRHGFVRLERPSARDASDRSAPDSEHRPPSTRLMSPNGIALRFYLIALLEAQVRTRAGARPGDNPMALRGEGPEIGWSDFVATSAVASGEGRTRMSLLDKKVRQLQTTLKRLDAENLVDLPNKKRTQGKYERFLLNRDDARHHHVTDLYRVPNADESTFAVPLELFTRGWIYVLEDSELALLLITARNFSKYGQQQQPLPGGVRVMNYGLGQDSFEAHRVLEYLGLIDVSSDYRRQSNGQVADYDTKGPADPHKLLFIPAGLEKHAVTTFLTAIQDQLAASETLASTDAVTALG
jgi:hypothetical protein